MRYALITLIAVVALAGCTSSTGGSDAMGVEVSCGSQTVTQFVGSASTGSGDEALCDVEIDADRINRDDNVCNKRATLYDDPADIPCPGFADLKDGMQVRAEVTFYEPGTTNEIGADGETIRIRNDNDE